MRIPRFHTEQALIPAQTVLLEDAASHHLLNVLRMQPGAPLILFNGDGKEYLAVLQAAAKKQARVLIREMRQTDSEPRLRIALGQGISRGERMDLVLQKSVELGVHSITPLWTQRSQVQLGGARLERRYVHWRGVIRSACEQSGRVCVPQLHNAVKLQEWYRNDTHGAVRLVLDPTASLLLSDISPAKDISVLIGPEGGLRDDEISTAGQHGFLRVRLGPRILRTETAALAILAALQTLWGDFAAR